MKTAISASMAVARMRRAPSRAISVSGSAIGSGWWNGMTLVSSFMADRCLWRFRRVWSPATIRRPLNSHNPVSATARFLFCPASMSLVNAQPDRTAVVRTRMPCGGEGRRREGPPLSINDLPVPVGRPKKLSQSPLRTRSRVPPFQRRMLLRSQVRNPGNSRLRHGEARAGRHGLKAHRQTGSSLD